MIEIILISLAVGTVASILKSIIKSNKHYNKRNNRKYYKNTIYSKNNLKNDSKSNFKYELQINEPKDKITNYIETEEYNQYYQQKVKLYEHLKKDDNFIEKGKNYELQIKKFYENKNYKVDTNGINKGKKDGGIDLIALKDNEIILIQCKNHQKEIEQDLIRKFIGDCYVFESKNKDITKNRKIKREFVSNSSADYGSKMFLNENTEIVNFLNIKANF